MPENMFCPDCKILYTYQAELGALGCARCGRPRITIQPAEEPVRQPEQDGPVEDVSNKEVTSSGGSTPPLCATTGGGSDIRT